MSNTPKPVSEADLSPYVAGDVIDGKYRVEGVLGEGSFGWVFMASHVRVQALTHAVKVLKAEHTTDAETVARFHREAETVASLRSKHSVRVTDFGVAPEGLPYIVMEFVDGLSIGDMLFRGGPFPEDDVLELTLHTLRALDEAHRMGIVHRDLKPDNIIVVRDPDSSKPVARVLDFGLAKILEPENFQVRPEATAAGLVLCTARYAAPDLLKGNPSAQSDIYALGISMIEMLDGRPPYAGEDFYTVAAKHIDPAPVPMGERSSESFLAPVIERATAKRLDRRYESAAAMIADLEALLAQREAARGVGYHDTVSQSVMKRFTLPSGVEARERRRRKLAIVGVAAALLVALVVLLAIAVGGRSNDGEAVVAAVDASDAASNGETEGTNGTAAGDTLTEAERARVAGLAERSATVEGRATRARAAAVAGAVAADVSTPEPEPIVEESEPERATERPTRPSRSERRPSRPTAEPTPEPNPEIASDEGAVAEDESSTSDGESGTDGENLFGGIRTIGGP